MFKPMVPYLNKQGKTATGFKSPADDFTDRNLDLNEQIIANPAATFFVKVDSNLNQGLGINKGDTLVIDRSKNAHADSLVLATINGNFKIRKVHTGTNGTYLVTQNYKFKPVKIDTDTDCSVWGVITHVIRKTV